MSDDLPQNFEDIYVSSYSWNAPRQPPHFAIDLWNILHRTDDELPRTNNSIESWHRISQAHVLAWLPVFWKLLSVLQKEKEI